jgi:lipoprotein-releasing system permease protein
MFEAGVAIRFLTEGKVQTALILVGISVGVAVQIFLSALIGGLQKDLIDKTVGTSPHITARPADPELPGLIADSLPALVRKTGGGNRARRPLRQWEPVVRQLREMRAFTVVSPVAEGGGFAFRGDRSRPVLLRGVDLAAADRLYRFSLRMVAGEAAVGSNSILIGTGLAADLQLEVGGTLRLSTPGGGGDVFTVSGIFDLEAKPLNDGWVILPLSRAQALLGFDGGISAIEMQVTNLFRAKAIAARLQESFPEIEWVSWQESNASLLAGLRSQSGSSNMIQVLVLLAVTLGISSVLAVSAIQKARQIGILKAIGATRAMISRIFLIMGALLGFTGAVLGSFLGYGLIVGFLVGTTGANGKPLFPLSISPSLYGISITIATLAGTFAASIPARRSARLNPVEVIRNG